MKPICVACRRFFRPKKNGYPFIEGMPTRDKPRPGCADPNPWRPYKLWLGDQWECAGCGASIIIGVGAEPVAEHFQPEFQERISSFGASLQVNDC